MKKLILALTVTLLSTSALAQQTFVPIRSITVTGMAERKVVPSEAHIQVNLNSMAMKLADAKTAHDKKLKKLMGIVKAEGIDEKKVRTENSNIQPIYDYRHDAKTNQSIRVFKGYRAQTNLDITVADSEKVGSLTDKITTAGFEEGANTEWGNLLNLDYRIANPEQISDELLAQAIANAREKADRMASAAGASIDRVYQVHENGAPNFNYPRAVPMMAMAKMEGGAAADAAYAPPAGEQNVQATVSVTFELK